MHVISCGIIKWVGLVGFDWVGIACRLVLSRICVDVWLLEFPVFPHQLRGVRRRRDSEPTLFWRNESFVWDHGIV